MSGIPYSIRVTTPPAAEPVTLAELKLHARIEHATEDANLAVYLAAARRTAERLVTRAFVTQTLTLTLDRFPGCVIELRRPPVQAVTSVKYFDTAGVLTTLDPGEYQLDAKSEPGRLMPAHGKSWPATRDVPGAVQVEFIAGYGDAGADVPDGIRTAILQIASHLAEHRTPVSDGVAVSEVPMSAKLLLGVESWGGYA